MSRLFLCLVILSAAVVLAKKEDLPEIKRRLFKLPVQPTSCRQLNKCCQGKDNSCKITLIGKKSEEDSARENLSPPQNSTASCFCDSACLALGDCCPDYNEFCSPVNCVVADTWDEWGECDVKCGSGIKQRTRKIIQAPLNGGEPCPTTVEKIPCEGLNCKQARASFLKLKDTAHIISAKYGPWRISSEYHPRRGIRKNLFDRYSANVTERPSYCIVFQLTQVDPGCNESTQPLERLGFDQKDIDFFHATIVKGGQVCVECQDTAMKSELGGRCTGDGVINKETRWSIHSGCRGKWKMISKQDQCTCGAKKDGSKPSFLFI